MGLKDKMMLKALKMALIDLSVEGYKQGKTDFQKDKFDIRGFKAEMKKFIGRKFPF